MKNSQKGFIVPILIIIVVLIIGGGIYYYSRDSQSIPINYNGVETKDWKTYTNQKYGFSFNYPPILTASELSPVGESVTVSNPVATNERGSGIAFSVVKGDLLKLKSGSTSSLNLEDRGEIPIGGYKAKKVFRPFGPTNTTIGTIVYYISEKDISILYQLYTSDSHKISESDMNKILSTFKFTDIKDNSGTVTSSTNNSFLITYPKGGENLEIGKTYKLAWQNNSGKAPKAIAIQTISQNGEDYGYGNIITSNIPSANTGSTDWTVASTFNPKYSYKLVIFGDNREILGSSGTSFSIVDKRPLSVTIAGGDKIVIDKNNLFTFNKPFTLSGTASQNGSMTTYSSSADLQKIFVQVSISKFSADACEVLHAYDAPICDVKGEQAVTLDLIAVLSDDTSSWITKRKISLSSKTIKTRQLERVGSNYKIELVSMDLQNKTASIIVNPI